MSETNVITGLIRFSYPSVFVAKSVQGSDPKYSVVLLIKKSDKETLDAINAAVVAAFVKGKAILGAKSDKMPASLNPLKDGDIKAEEENDPTYAGNMYISANGNRKPGIIDAAKKDITNPDEFYAGCYGRASINFYAYNVGVNKGIACGLNNLQKIKEGQRLDGRKDAKDDFNDDFADSFAMDEEDDLSFLD